MPTSPFVIDYHDTFSFPIAPEDLWVAIGRTDRFEDWWSWLSQFSSEGNGLRAGSVLRGVVSPPLPYRMRLRIDLERCEPPSRIEAAVHGDLEGHASVTIVPDDVGTRVEVGWTIEMKQRSMRVAARVAHPVLRWGHDRLVDATVRSFSRHLGNSRER